MGFRDDGEALRERVEELERELARLEGVEAERDRLRAEVKELRAELDRLAPKPKPKPAPARPAERDDAPRPRGGLASSLDARERSSALVVMAGVLTGVLGVGTTIAVMSRANPSSAPSVGEIDLDAHPEPAELDLEASGDVPAPSGCSGYLPDSPQLVLRTTHPTRVTLSPTATSGDLVMRALLPNGESFCDDDSGGALNPSLSLTLPPGDTRVWVGTYERGERLDFSLRFAARPLDSGSVAGGAGLLLEGPELARSSEGDVRGERAASELDASCRGFLTLTPQATLRLSARAGVRLNARSDTDLVLAVTDSTGRAWCDDDGGPGTTPQIATLLPEDTYAVWVGTYSEASAPVPYVLDVSAVAIDDAPDVQPRPLGATDVVVEGTSADEIASEALGAPCRDGLVGATPAAAFSVDGTYDVVLSLAAEDRPFGVVIHPDRSFDCIEGGVLRHRWDAGVHRVYVGVRDEGRPGAYTLTAHTAPVSLRPWERR